MSPDLDQDVIDKVTSHMNRDHSGAVLILARKMAACPRAVSAEMVGLNSGGMTLNVKFEKGLAQVVLEFESPIKSSGEIKQAIIDLLRRAREME